MWQKNILILIFMNVIFLTAAILSEIIDSEKLHKNLKEDINSGIFIEENYPISGLGIRMDHYTDCVVVSRNVVKVKNYDGFENIIYNPVLTNCNNLKNFIESKTYIDTEIEFIGRYWLGSAVIFKLVGTVGGLSLINAFINSLTIIGLAFTFLKGKKEYGTFPTIFFLLPFIIFSGILDTEKNAVFALSMIPILIFGPKLIGSISKFDVTTAIIVGSLVAFFDTFVVIGLGTLLFGFMLLGKDLKSFIRILTFYEIGYFFTWASKWLILSMYDGREVRKILEVIIERGGNKLPDGEIITPFMSFNSNFIEFIRQSPIPQPVMAVLAALLFFYSIKSLVNKSINSGIYQKIVLLSFLPVVEILILLNHSYWHHQIYAKILSGTFSILIFSVAYLLKEKINHLRSII